ncbi:MAG TPA: hypothetical protein VGF85_00060 [Opitutaceae bacterium]|jgi:hypothetical protein
MNISSSSSQLTGLIPGTLRDADAASAHLPGAAASVPEPTPETAAGSGAPSTRPAALASLAAGAETDRSEPAFSASDAQSALQVALRALAARPDAAIAAQAPSSPSSILGLLEVA